MADVKGIQTKDGVVRIDYNNLTNLPKADPTLSESGRFADAAMVGQKIKELENKVETPSLRWSVL